jgi:leucyl-tRNA synthetase
MSEITQYHHHETEAKWQKIWNDLSLYITDISNSNKPFYNLMMFPYPSAEGLHVGNMYAFTGSDIYGRFKSMQGYQVFEPIGLDGFGIHSENYAMKIGKNPADHAAVTEKNYYKQLLSIGARFDWSRTVETYKPDYYHWTQWLFVTLFKQGLVYRSNATVNWCPSCKTVLADEQVIDSKCERCGNIVVKKELTQWFIKITNYAERLHSNIETLQWSEKVKVAQKNWIGKKEGLNITYAVIDRTGKNVGEIECFTTRPDTNFGATFVVIAPEHAFVNQVFKVLDEVEHKTIRDYIENAKNISDQDRIAMGRQKTGVFTGLYCINNLNGERMPLYISDFVLKHVGTGAVVGVPGHDARDYDFATAFNIPIKRVISPKIGEDNPIQSPQDVIEEGFIINSDFLNSLQPVDAIKKIVAYAEEKGWGKKITTYHLRDWLISRQRYWGPPIPMIFCQHCADNGNSWFTKNNKRAPSSLFDTQSSEWSAGWYPVEDNQLPVTLPYIEDFRPGDDGIPPLKKHKEFYETVCPGCGNKAVRETEVSDTFLDSSWYFLRYPSVGKNDVPFDSDLTKKWLPVHMYSGGAEHSVLHLMYSRFITMALYDMGHIHFEEPFTQFFAHGLVIKDGAKMSKSKGNVVNPDEYIRLYGADALRLYLMFMGPYSDGGDFRDSAMEGMSRWVGRIYRLAHQSISNKETTTNDDVILKVFHRLIKKVGEDIERRHYNTAIAAMMEFSNLVIDRGGSLHIDILRGFMKCLAPFAPHIAEEIYQLTLNRETIHTKEDSIHSQSWPVFDSSLLTDNEISIIVQVNGKVRGRLVVSNEEGNTESSVKDKAMLLEGVVRFIEPGIKKTIFIAGKVINFVV